MTLHSLFTAKDVVYDPALEGAWKSGETTTWTIKPLDKQTGRYTLQTTMKDQPQAEYYATLGTVGTNRFLELKPQRPNTIHQKSFYGMHFVQLRSFWKVTLAGDKLVLTSMSSQWLDTMIKQKKTDVRYEKPDEGLLFITASTAELREFVGKYADDAGAFPVTGDEKGLDFVRSKDVSSTTDKE